jgi:hypothetical protein
LRAETVSVSMRLGVVRRAGGCRAAGQSMETEVGSQKAP